MTDNEILIKLLSKLESTGGWNSKITVSMLKCFLEEIEKEKKQSEDEYAKFQTYFGI